MNNNNIQLYFLNINFKKSIFKFIKIISSNKGGEEMDNSNIIISVIIVLCIAAGVTAYGISEGDNAVFNDLTGFSPDSSSSGDNGIGGLFGDDSTDGTGEYPHCEGNAKQCKSPGQL